MWIFPLLLILSPVLPHQPLPQHSQLSGWHCRLPGNSLPLASCPFLTATHAVIQCYTPSLLNTSQTLPLLPSHCTFLTLASSSLLVQWFSEGWSQPVIASRMKSHCLSMTSKAPHQQALLTSPRHLLLFYLPLAQALKAGPLVVDSGSSSC